MEPWQPLQLTFLRLAVIVSLASLLGAAPQSGPKEWSRVFVNFYGCERDESSFYTGACLAGCRLYDQSQMSKARSNVTIRPTVHRAAGDE